MGFVEGESRETKSTFFSDKSGIPGQWMVVEMTWRVAEV